jgi:hypothetical protein
MSKCARCGERKGKRLCKVRSALICPVCCGEAREAEACAGCEFYRPPVRNYGALPRRSTHDVSESEGLQGISFSVEAAVCRLDDERDRKMTDAQAIEIFDLLLDLYAFADPAEVVLAKARALGCETVIDSVRSKLRGLDHAAVAQVIATVRFTACRRASGGRQHLELLHSFCDAGIGPPSPAAE